MTETILDDTLNDELPLDPIGNAAYGATFRFHRALQFFGAGLLIALLASIAANVWLARKPPVVLVVRVDEAGNAETIRYNAVHFTPREAEVKARLNDWAIDRYRLLKAVAGSNFKFNYDYLSTRLAAQLMPQDAPRLAKILAGNQPEQDVEVDNIQFTRIEGATGEAVIDLTKIINPATDVERQHWTVTVRYEVDPVAAAERARHDPQFGNLNPLGIIITWFHEDRAFR